MVRFCQDCKHYRTAYMFHGGELPRISTDYAGGKCLCPEMLMESAEYLATRIAPLCSEMRAGDCGIDGIYFEPKPPPPPPPPKAPRLWARIMARLAS